MIYFRENELFIKNSLLDFNYVHYFIRHNIDIWFWKNVFCREYINIDFFCLFIDKILSIMSNNCA